MEIVTKACEDCGTPVQDKNDPNFKGKWLCYWCYSIAEGKDPKNLLNGVATAMKLGQLVPVEDYNNRKARDVIARAFRWRDWAHVVHDSQRDGYTEAGGRGNLAAVIVRTAREAENLIEHVNRFGPDEDKIYETPKGD